MIGRDTVGNTHQELGLAIIEPAQSQGDVQIRGRTSAAGIDQSRIDRGITRGAVVNDIATAKESAWIAGIVIAESQAVGSLLIVITYESSVKEIVLTGVVNL